jgi:D-glycero-D-manno-heptose 1,7-bisphosphate phosphatase
MARLIILDRDGVINFDSPAFIKSAQEWHPIPRALEAIAELKAAGWLVAVCSNQSGVGRGLISPTSLDGIHEKMIAALRQVNVELDGLTFCPHRPEDHCRCRKPLPGMLTDMMKHLGVTAERTVVIGDSLRDIEAGLTAGCRCVLVRTGNGAGCEDAVRALGVDTVYDDLWTATLVLREESSCC